MQQYKHRREPDPIIVLIAIIFALLVLNASWRQINDYFGFEESTQEAAKR